MLGEEEKERVRYHLGYMATSGSAASLQFGIPKPAQTIFLLEQAFSLMTNQYAVGRVRKILSILDGIEDTMVSPGQATLLAEQLGTMKTRGTAPGQTATDLLEREYVRWAKRLADVMGVPLYPYADRFKRSGSGNVPVRRA
jgi:hypothetical protein